MGYGGVERTFEIIYLVLLTLSTAGSLIYRVVKTGQEVTIKMTRGGLAVNIVQAAVFMFWALEIAHKLQRLLDWQQDGRVGSVKDLALPPWSRRGRLQAAQGGRPLRARGLLV